jgi:hypothetical protein
VWKETGLRSGLTMKITTHSKACVSRYHQHPPCKNAIYTNMQITNNETRKILLHPHRRPLKPQFRQTRLPPPFLPFKPHLLRTYPRGRIHIHPMHTHISPTLYTTPHSRTRNKTSNLPINTTPRHPHRHPLTTKPRVAKNLEIPRLQARAPQHDSAAHFQRAV